ncbi:4-(cytidine 5'-diphospho)-2-C-methyl-D-erythritol kinase [bacterium]|nr:4-(cytidine 5'-diphospho)-2-C-methyl-D-erythritol kinase [bacterium]
MKSVKVQCPAKINLDLKVINKREDGFHNIESVMQTISLYDYLTISIDSSKEVNIVLSGTSDEIPYDERNLVYKAVKLFFDEVKIEPVNINVYIEKNIPIAAGLAGGSTDAAGTLYGLNKLFDDILSENELHNLCAKLGSDLNVCLMGGKLQTSGRGEKVAKLPFEEFSVNLIKPIELGISAKEAYTKFSHKMTNNIDIERRNEFVNDLEWAIIDDYSQLLYIKKLYPNSIMTGSGSTYFSVVETFKNEDGYWVKNDLKSVDSGVCIV